MFGSQQKNLGKALNSRTETGTRVASILHAAAECNWSRARSLRAWAQKTRKQGLWSLTKINLSMAVEKPCWETCRHRDCALDLFRVWARTVSTIGIFGPTLARYAHGSWPNLEKKKKKNGVRSWDALSVLWELPIIPTILVVLRSWLQPETRVLVNCFVH